MSDRRRAQLLDLGGPFRGPCGICGGPDARHRLADAIAERVRAGDSEEGVAEDYGLSTDAVATLAEHWWVWDVTSGHGVKRIHVQGCRYGRGEYRWAFGMNPAELTGELFDSGAWRWHRGCRVCCPEIDDVLHPGWPA